MAKRNPTSRKPSTKQIRVSTLHYARGATRPECEVPYLRLRGHWLAAAGFSPNALVTIHAAPGRLVITLA